VWDRRAIACVWLACYCVACAYDVCSIVVRLCVVIVCCATCSCNLRAIAVRFLCDSQAIGWRAPMLCARYVCAVLRGSRVMCWRYSYDVRAIVVRLFVWLSFGCLACSFALNAIVVRVCASPVILWRMPVLCALSSCDIACVCPCDVVALSMFCVRSSRALFVE